MDFERALALIRDAAPYSDFTSVAFTGGEPLLFPDEIIALAGAAKEAGKSSTIATAAHWAMSKGAARIMIERLVENGLNRLNVSFDKSHSEYVPEDNVFNIAEVIHEFGIPLYIVSTYYSAHDFERHDLSDESRGIFHFKKLVAKTGMAKKSSVEYVSFPDLSEMSCYRRVYHDLVVFYDGKTYPCCSTFNRASKGLILGNAWEVGFVKLRLRLLGSIMLKAMKGSFDTFVSIIKEHDAACADAISSLVIDSGACGFCHKVFKDPALFERVHAVFARVEDEVVAEAISKLRIAGITEVELTI